MGAKTLSNPGSEHLGGEEGGGEMVGRREVVLTRWYLLVLEFWWPGWKEEFV